MSRCYLKCQRDGNLFLYQSYFALTQNQKYQMILV